MFQYCDTNKLGGIEGENFKNCLVSASIGLSYREAQKMSRYTEKD